MEDVIKRQDALHAIASEPVHEARYTAWWVDVIKSIPSASGYVKVTDVVEILTDCIEPVDSEVRLVNYMTAKDKIMRLSGIWR